MTVFFNRATARTIDFRPGDVGYIPQTLGHYIENTGARLPPELVIAHLGISEQTLAAIPRANDAVLPV